MAPAVEATPGDTVWVALRPEKVRIATAPPAGGGDSNCVAGIVWDIGYLGNLSVYKVRLDDGQLFKATAANMTRLTERPIGWNDRVWLTWPADAGVVLTH